MVEIKACRETLKVARPLIFSKKRENIIGCIIIYIKIVKAKKENLMEEIEIEKLGIIEIKEILSRIREDSR